MPTCEEYRNGPKRGVRLVFSATTLNFGVYENVYRESHEWWDLGRRFLPHHLQSADRFLSLGMRLCWES